VTSGLLEPKREREKEREGPKGRALRAFHLNTDHCLSIPLREMKNHTCTHAEKRTTVCDF